MTDKQNFFHFFAIVGLNVCSQWTNYIDSSISNIPQNMIVVLKEFLFLSILNFIFLYFSLQNSIDFHIDEVKWKYRTLLMPACLLILIMPVSFSVIYVHFCCVFYFWPRQTHLDVSWLDSIVIGMHFPSSTRKERKSIKFKRFFGKFFYEK